LSESRRRENKKASIYGRGYNLPRIHLLESKDTPGEIRAKASKKGGVCLNRFSPQDRRRSDDGAAGCEGESPRRFTDDKPRRWGGRKGTHRKNPDSERIFFGRPSGELWRGKNTSKEAKTLGSLAQQHERKD